MRRVRTALLLATLSVPTAMHSAGEQGDLSRRIKGSDCLAWTVETYRIEARLGELGLDFSDEYAELVACVEHDLAMMPAEMPLGWCDNVLKVHCSALDLLTEIGEAEISRCEKSLGAALGIEPAEHRQWRTCGRNAVFDRFAKGGASGDAETCRSVLLAECGTQLDPRDELPAETRSFVDCCTATAIDPEDREAGRCAMIDDAFTRGPCLDRPVCVNRETGDWLACAD